MTPSYEVLPRTVGLLMPYEVSSHMFPGATALEPGAQSGGADSGVSAGRNKPQHASGRNIAGDLVGFPHPIRCTISTLW